MQLPRFSLPCSPEEFLRDYWQKKPLLMRQATNDLSWLDGNLLAGLALEEEVESRLVLGTNETGLSMQQGPFDDDTFANLPKKDWTLLVQSVDHYLTEASLLLDSFNFLPAWRLEDIMVSYAAQGGGVGPHYDLYDVFLVQTSGTKRWKIGGFCDANTPLQTHESLKLINNMQVIDEYVLEPGDVLYLPPGLAHWGLAESNDCITWSVGLRAPELFQLTDWLLAESEEHRQSRLFNDACLLTPDDAQATITPKLSEALLQQATQQLKALNYHALLTQWLSLPRQSSIELVGVDQDAILAMEPNAILVRHGGTRLLLEDAEATCAYINGACFEVSASSRNLVKLLASKRVYTHNDLAAFTQQNETDSLLASWIEAGFFYTL